MKFGATLNKHNIKKIFIYIKESRSVEGNWEITFLLTNLKHKVNNKNNNNVSCIWIISQWGNNKFA